MTAMFLPASFVLTKWKLCNVIGITKALDTVHSLATTRGKDDHSAITNLNLLLPR